MFWLELAVVLAAIFVGARLGGIGLGVMGGSASPSSPSASTCSRPRPPSTSSS